MQNFSRNHTYRRNHRLTIAYNNCVQSNSTYLNRDDLSGRFLELLELTQEIPETRLGYDGLWGKYPHFVKRGDLLLLGRELAPDHLELFQLKTNNIN